MGLEKTGNRSGDLKGHGESTGSFTEFSNFQPNSCAITALNSRTDSDTDRQINKKKKMVKATTIAGAGIFIAAAGVVAVTAAISQIQKLQNERVQKARDERTERAQASAAEELTLQQQVKDYMEKELENMMIDFKRSYPDASFVEFLLNHFPENVKIEGDRNKLDERVRNDNWEGRYNRLSADSELHELGPLPNLTSSQN
jgi:hypothetical protein